MVIRKGVSEHIFVFTKHTLNVASIAVAYFSCHHQPAHTSIAAIDIFRYIWKCMWIWNRNRRCFHFSQMCYNNIESEAKFNGEGVGGRDISCFLRKLRVLKMKIGTAAAGTNIIYRWLFIMCIEMVWTVSTCFHTWVLDRR